MNQSEVMGLIREAKSLPALVAMLKHNEVDSALHDWAVRRYLDVRARERGVPLIGMFELTPCCNLDCKMCYVHLNTEQLKGRKTLSAKEWELIMDEAIEAGMMYATITGGECLIYPEFDRLYQYLHDRGIQLRVFTNGVLLDEKRIEFFKKYPPAVIQITLYGVDEDSYECVTGKRMYTRVMRNIQAACEAGLPLVLAVTPNKYLGEDNEVLVKTAVQSGLPIRMNIELMTPRSDTERENDFSDLAPETYIRLIKLKQKLRGEEVPADCMEEPRIPVANEDGQIIKGLRCGAGRSGFKITWEGNICPCENLAWAGVSVRDGMFSEGWKKIHQFAEEFLLPIECETCAYKSLAKGCPAEHRARKGHADPVQCEWCKKMFKAGFSCN